MNDLKRTSELVERILVESQEARNSDMVLYYKVCEKLNGVTLGMPFGMVIVNLKQFKLPAFETVRRTRQKVQEKHPELSGCADVEAYRMVKETEFREYARGNG